MPLSSFDNNAMLATRTIIISMSNIKALGAVFIYAVLHYIWGAFLVCVCVCAAELGKKKLLFTMQKKRKKYIYIYI